MGVLGRERETERQRQTETDRYTDIDRETDRQKKKKTETERKNERECSTLTSLWKETNRERVIRSQNSTTVSTIVKACMYTYLQTFPMGRRSLALTTVLPSLINSS